MSKVQVFHSPGRAFELAQFPDREPQGTEIRVRIRCCTLCSSDLHTHAGRRIEPLPTVLGHEAMGCIEAFGPQAVRLDYLGETLSTGDRITWSVAASCGSCYYCSNDLPQKCSTLFKYGHERLNIENPYSGGLAGSIVLRPGTACFRVPDTLSDMQAAAANCSTATVAATIRHAGMPLTKRSVLIFGAGLLGLTASAMARYEGACAVIVCDPDLKRHDTAKAFGATHTVTTDEGQLADIIKTATQGRGPDVVLELSGASQAVHAGIKLARIGGVVVLAGTVRPTAPVSLEPEWIVRRLLCIRGVHNYAPVDLAAALTFLAGPGAAFPFSRMQGKAFKLEECDQAFAHAHANPGARVAIVNE